MTTRMWGLVAVSICAAAAGCRDAAPAPADPVVRAERPEWREPLPGAPNPAVVKDAKFALPDVVIRDGPPAVAPEVELARLRNEIALLDGDIKKLINNVARERFEVNQLKEKRDEIAAKQVKDHALLLARGQAIKDAEAAGAATVPFGSRTLTVTQAKEELVTGVNRFNVNQKTLEAHSMLLTNRIKARDTLEKQLEAMKNQKDELKAAVETLETEPQGLKLQKIESKYQNDDSRMDKIKEDIQKLKTRMAVKHEELKLVPSPLDDVPKGKSVDDILKGLGPKPPEPKRE